MQAGVACGQRGDGQGVCLPLPAHTAGLGLPALQNTIAQVESALRRRDSELQEASLFLRKAEFEQARKRESLEQRIRQLELEEAELRERASREERALRAANESLKR
ncbi:UNVERIFIED_CONTAM: hypothetical protein FKN15_000702 [Acipenser sinensis]